MSLEPYRVENLYTMAFTTVLVLGLFLLGAGGMSMWGFLLLLNLKYISYKKEGEE